ncbi:hypothetical protein [Gilliamella sp. wkB112]|uniref:hypothetical protein n=1 Tax=Gilliamella sp. wkB112 TaxID=3120257 RepID=UPI00080E2F11|nr:hypothetical protein [Gilliamella apicola]OCG02996.1 hypothetical protein A9G12_08720 [Gilliamella apicola]
MKKLLTTTILLAIVISYLLLSYVNKPTLVQETAMQLSQNKSFLTFINSLSEKNVAAAAKKKGLVTTGSWTDRENRYDIFTNQQAQQIDQNPSQYLSDAIEVIKNSNYDQSQKMYTIIMMQHLPIKEYLSFMETVNTAFEEGIITDKFVFIEAIKPNLALKSTTQDYWDDPMWIKQFKRNANKVLSTSQIESILNGDYVTNSPY